MKKAASFRMLLVCAIAAAEALAGPSVPAPKNPPAKSPWAPNTPGMLGNDPTWTLPRRVKILLVRIIHGRGGMVYERLERVNLGTAHWLDDEQASGTGQDRTVTLVTDSLAAALAGDGRGGGRNSGAGELGRSFLYRSP